MPALWHLLLVYLQQPLFSEMISNLQYYRDFAENKGKFTVGASNIEIKDKSGNTLDALFPNVPMPDFSAANRNLGIATLVAPQYLVSVAHNTQYNTVEFGAQALMPMHTTTLTKSLIVTTMELLKVGNIKIIKCHVSIN